MTDLIDRQAAIDAVVAWTVEDRPDIEMPTELVGRINALPPAQQWIPCNWHRNNENLPEECKSVLICIVDSNKIYVDVSYRTDYNRWERYGRVNVTAWMPLPEPYIERGEQDG